MGIRSILKCPVCDKELWVEPVIMETHAGAAFTGKLAVYCGYGPCPSHVTNDGGIGITEEQAYDVLCRKVEDEYMMNDNGG